MGFKISNIFNYLIDYEIPKDALKETMMEAVTIDNSEIHDVSLETILHKEHEEQLHPKHFQTKRPADRREKVRDRKVEVETKSIPDYISITLKGLILTSRIEKEDIDFLIVASKYSDFRHPFTAGTVQDTMELKPSLFTFDLQGSDDIFLKAMEFSSSLLDGVKYNKGVIIFADELYNIAKFRNRRIPDDYFDIASALLVAHDDEAGIQAVNYWSEGHRARYHILGEDGILDESHFYYMSGEDMQKYISSISDSHIEDTLAEANLSINDISLFYINSPSSRIVSKVLVSKGVPIEKIIYQKGDKSMLSKFYPFMIDHTIKRKAVKAGDYIFISSFGRGLTYGNMIIKM